MPGGKDCAAEDVPVCAWTTMGIADKKSANKNSEIVRIAGMIPNSTGKRLGI